MVKADGPTTVDEVFLQHESVSFQWDEATGYHRDEWHPGVPS